MTKVLNRAPVFRKKDSSQPYFEGYYFKFINNQKEIVILIAGISISATEKFSFIQIASNYDKEVSLHKFPLKDLESSENSFFFKIGNNAFGPDKITINIHEITAEIHLKNSIQWSRSILNPNIMGILSYVPKVECKHDVITINTEVSGYINLVKHNINFDNGDGYIEKNWGYSFPKKYMWLHANQFQNKAISLQFATAKPKWIFIRPKVHIGYVMSGKPIHFGTHKLSIFRVRSDSNSISITIKTIKHIITINVKNRAPVNLIGPEKGQLKNEIAEYLNSEIELIVIKRKFLKSNVEVIRDTSNLSTTEMHNALNDL
jgi:hypothetical protein